MTVSVGARSFRIPGGASTWNHSGGAAPAGVLVYVVMSGVTSPPPNYVSYAGIQMGPGKPAGDAFITSPDNAGEPGSVYAYWWDSPPAGTQTVVVVHGSPAPGNQNWSAYVTSYNSAVGNPLTYFYEIQHGDSTQASQTVTVPGHPTTSLIGSGAYYSGRTNALGPGAACTSYKDGAFSDVTATCFEFLYRTINPSTGSVLINTQVGGASDDLAFIAVGVVEMPNILGEAFLGGVSNTTADGVTLNIGTANLTATDSLVVDGTVTTLGSASLIATDSLVVAGTVTKLGAAALTATDSLVVVGNVSRFGAAALTATDLLVVSGTVDTPGSIDKVGEADLLATDDLTVDGTIETFSAADLTATDSLTIDGTIETFGAADLLATDDLTVDGTIEVIGAAVLIALEALTVDGDITSSTTTLQTITLDVDLPATIDTTVINIRIDTWTIFPFQGGNDYIASISATLDNAGRITVFNDGLYNIVYNIPTTADDTGGVTTWSSRLVRSSSTGTHIDEAPVSSPILYPEVGAVTDNILVRMESDYMVWVEVKVHTTGSSVSIPVGTSSIEVGGLGSYFVGNRAGD